MQGSYNLWLVAGSYLVAALASYAALELAGRVGAAKGRSTWAWLAGGSITMGMGVWSMHFVAMLAFHLPIPLAYDLPITLASLLPAIFSAALVLELVRRGGLRGWRLGIAAAVLGCGIAAMHYAGMAAIPVAPGIRYQPWILLASVAVAIAVAYVALRLAFSLKDEVSRAKKGAAALVMGAAIAAMHYTGMAAAQFAPDSVCMVTPGTIDNLWLGGMIGFNTVMVLMLTIAIAAYDARFADENARMVTALKAANQELAGYYATMEEEKRIAKHLIDRLTAPSKVLADSADSWILPARYFSGDLVAIARTPEGTLHVLLGDSTGHGLAAALGALPVVQPFYAMTAKGFAISNIAREINGKVAAMLPTGRFVAAAIAAIDSRRGLVRVWNGGIPSCHVLDAEGRSLKRFASTHPPLGILPGAQFDTRVETLYFDQDCQLFMVSDGLTEAENAAGQAFGEEGMLEVLSRALPSVRVRTLSAAVLGHIAYQQPSDDISIVVAQCKKVAAHQAVHAPQAGDGDPLPLEGTRLHLSLDASELKRSDVVPTLCNLLGELGVARKNLGQLFVVLSELYNNALDHGLLELDSALKQGTEGFESYLVERGRRLEQLEDGRIEIEVQCIERNGRFLLRIRVRDTGHGFVFGPYLTIPLDELTSSKQYGRGIGLVRSLCSDVDYRDAGRESEVYLPLQAMET